MGFLDKVKNAAKGRGAQIKGGIDKASAEAAKRVEAKHRDTIGKAADAAKQQVDKLDPQSADTDRDATTRPSGAPAATAQPLSDDPQH